MGEPEVTYRVLNGPMGSCQKPKQMTAKADPNNPKLLVVFIPEENRTAQIPNNVKNREMLNGLNCDCSLLIGLNGDDAGSDEGTDWAKVAESIKSVMDSINWKALGWDEEAATQKLLSDIRDRDDYRLYPRPQEGGPWRNYGFGNLGRMSLDELRYFIEWRMPMLQKNNNKKDWGDTKPRVIERYKRVTDIMKQTAIDMYKKKVGCYEHSGLYDSIVAAASGKDRIRPFSDKILTYRETCPPPSSGGGISKSTQDYLTKTGSQVAAPKQASLGGTLGIISLLAIGGGMLYKKSKEKKNKKPAKGMNDRPIEVAI